MGYDRYGVKDQNSRWTFSWLRVGDSGVKRGTNPLSAWVRMALSPSCRDVPRLHVGLHFSVVVL
jgi:hypothetical protein